MTITYSRIFKYNDSIVSLFLEYKIYSPKFYLSFGKVDDLILANSKKFVQMQNNNNLNLIEF